jgi:hypothetical protein
MLASGGNRAILDSPRSFRQTSTHDLLVSFY